MPEIREDLSFELQLEGLQEWRNIPVVIKQAFAKLYNQVKAQSNTIRELENRQKGFAQRQDFLSGLSSKISVQEHVFKMTKLEEHLGKTAMLRDLHNNTAAQAALQKKVQTLGKSTDAKVSHADVQHSVQLQRQQIAQVQKELDIKVAVLSTATSKLATELSALQHHQEAAEKGAYAALCDVHKAVDRVNTEAAASLDRLSSSMGASTSEIKQSQALQQEAVHQSIDAAQREIAELRTSSTSLQHLVNSKADREYLQQVMEHLRNTKASIVELQAVKEVLGAKAGIKDVNAALSQVSQDVDSKVSTAELHDLRLFKAGGILGPSGRWQWTTGKLRRSGAVSWNKQCTPCDPQHFLHNKADITVIDAGVYEVVAAFFSKRRPTFQLLVNGSVALRAGSHAACTGQHTAARALCFDGLTGHHVNGTSVVDHLMLPSDACLTVIYPSQQEAGQGFISLQQLC